MSRANLESPGTKLGLSVLLAATSCYALSELMLLPPSSPKTATIPILNPSIHVWNNVSCIAGFWQNIAISIDVPSESTITPTAIIRIHLKRVNELLFRAILTILIHVYRSAISADDNFALAETLSLSNSLCDFDLREQQPLGC
jgi:hypothetical protein